MKRILSLIHTFLHKVSNTPVGASKSTPTHVPDAKCVVPMKATTPEALDGRIRTLSPKHTQSGKGSSVRLVVCAVSASSVKNIP